jgi:hypothetical protein
VTPGHRPFETPRVSRKLIDPSRAREALGGMQTLDGLLGCAIVDSATGVVLAHELRAGHPVDIELAAAASAQILRAHRQAAHHMGFADPTEEIVTTAGARQQLMRVVARHPDLFVMALLDTDRTNLARARTQLIEVERSLP